MMDTVTPPPPPRTTTTTPKSPEPESETPTRIQPAKPISFSNHRIFTYKECLKNHAASLGGHSLDGCGEFMPSPSSLFCAACNCHRNFHRRHHPPPPRSPPNSSSPPPISSSYILMNSNFSSDLNRIGSRKRFRTKFSQFQKEKMHEFADRVHWKIQKRDEENVRDFCNQIGVHQNVLKVWMHNNKNNRRDLPSAVSVAGIDTPIHGSSSS